MRECRKRVDLDAIPPPPDRVAPPPCLHYIAAWGAGRGAMAEAVLWGLEGNRELQIRSLRPREVQASRIEACRVDLEAAARRFAHEVPSDVDGEAVLFGDVHERNHVAREFAHFILGPDPIPPGMA